MGGGEEQSGGTTVVNQTTTPTPTAEETAMNQILLGRMQATNAATTQAQLSGLSLVNQLLTGQVPGGFYGTLGQGVSPTSIANQATTMMRSGRTGAQAVGIAESGETDKAIAEDIAGNLMFPAEQFNIGSLQNLLNLALTGQAQVQQPMNVGTSILGTQLAGLRPTTNQSTTNWSGYQPGAGNPFLNALGGGLGTGIGMGAGAGLFGLMGCWVAKEIFGSWEHPKTIKARFFINNLAPKWFKNFYLKYGERIAKFIHNKSILKLVLRPLFETFAILGSKGDIYEIA